MMVSQFGTMQWLNHSVSSAKDENNSVDSDRFRITVKMMIEVPQADRLPQIGGR